jgi:hypothetical protein
VSAGYGASALNPLTSSARVIIRVLPGSSWRLSRGSSHLDPSPGETVETPR